MSIVYLEKENDDLISHCTCKPSLVGRPGQLNCPWCGCGWLFSCLSCRKAFTFAKAVHVNKTWEELAKDDLFSYYKKEPSNEKIQDWVEEMKELTEHIELGESYIYLDGFFIPKDEEDFEANGWNSKHDFTRVPQVLALEDPSVLDSVLGNAEYWRKNEI